MIIPIGPDEEIDVPEENIRAFIRFISEHPTCTINDIASQILSEDDEYEQDDVWPVIQLVTLICDHLMREGLITRVKRSEEDGKDHKRTIGRTLH